MNIVTRKTTLLLSLTAVLVMACSASKPESDTLSSKTNLTEVHVQGVPGGVITSVTKMTAKVSAIDYKKRNVTLEDDKGNRKTLVIGPEAINFEQVKKGDIVKVAVAEELVVYLREKGAPMSDGPEAMIARAPEGNKPAVMMAGTEEIITKVKAIDLKAHTATLEFPDGSSKTVAVRPDVKLDKSQIGKEVAIRKTAAIALSVEKP